jgi:lipoprotein-releasing system permease protein
LITQKRKEMGLLMALGLSARRLMDLFQKVGMYLAGIGLGLGGFVGVIVSLYIENHPLQVLLDIYYDSEVPAQVDFIFVGFVFLTATIVIYGAVRLAMGRLAHLRPSEALRGL